MKERSPTLAKNVALQYYDFYYAPIFGLEWNKIRLAMLTGHKYTALINNYNDSFKHSEELEALGALNLIEHSIKIKSQNSPDDSTKLIEISPFLKVFCFDNGNVEFFPAPRKTDNKILSKLFSHVKSIASFELA